MQNNSWNLENTYVGLCRLGKSGLFANSIEIDEKEKIIQHVFFAAGIIFTFASSLVKSAVESGLFISTMAMTSHIRLLEYKSMSMAVYEVTVHYTIFPHVKY